jgi:type IV pilus assembly protein PilQ
VQEQNAIVVTGPADVVGATEAFVREIDRPVQQLLLEVLVVEFETSGLRRLGVTFLGGLLPTDSDLPAGTEEGWHTYVFGAGADQRGGLDLTGDGAGLGRVINFWSDLLGIRSIGRLPLDFHARLQALEHAGRAEVRSRPHIATLNGHTANITVGTSQYYRLRSVLPYSSGGVFGGEEMEHFEYVQADVRLDITPWVTGDGGVTAVIRPSFTTPIGPFDPRVPPTLQRWSVDTSIRLQDGETFMIGGLIQQRAVDSENRVPLLGRIPLLGRLFRNSERRRGTSELVIFITPHVLAGTDAPEVVDEGRRRHIPEMGPARHPVW